MIVTRRERERQRHRQREKQAPSREPEAGLNPGSPGSCPGLKVALNRWATGAAPNILFFFFKILFIYLFMRDREREAETQAEGETGSMWEACRGTQSRVSRIKPWAEGSAKPLSHLGCP